VDVASEAHDYNAPTLVTSCTTLPPEGAIRLWPGEAGSTAPLEWIGCAVAGSNLFASRPLGGVGRPTK
jgi:hypothetical protein